MPVLAYGSGDEPSPGSRHAEAGTCQGAAPEVIDRFPGDVAVWVGVDPKSAAASEPWYTGMWVGTVPRSDAYAYRIFDSYFNYVTSGSEPRVDTRIQKFIGTLVARWPDDLPWPCSPWVDPPLVENASGPLLYFEIAPGDIGEEAWDYAVSTAREQGLVAFDVTSRKLAR